MMSPAEIAEMNKQLVRSFFERAFVAHDLGGATQLLARDYALHDPSRPGFAGGPDEFRRFQQPFEDAIENQSLSIEDQLADGDKVVTRWTMTGTQRADLPGIPNRGKSFMIRGITISRVSKGLVAEEWQVWDDAGLRQQLSV
jgi:steroid delta-isomerase-like uncharacterized protein